MFGSSSVKKLYSNSTGQKIKNRYALNFLKIKGITALAEVAKAFDVNASLIRFGIMNLIF
jgi:hypothetical protein